MNENVMKRHLLGVAFVLMALPVGCGPSDGLPRVPDYTPSPEASTAGEATSAAPAQEIPGSPPGVNMEE